MGCITRNPKKDKQKIALVKSALNRWFDNKAIQIATGGDVRFFKEKFSRITGEDFDFGQMPSRKKLRKLIRHIERTNDKIYKKPGFLTKWIFLTEDVLDSPTTRGLFDEMFVTHNYYRGSMDKYTSNLKQIVSHLRDASGIITESEGILNWPKRVISFNRARRNLRDKYTEFYKARQENRPDDALDIMNELQAMFAKNEYKVFAMADEIFRDPNKYLDINIDKKYIGPIVQAAKVWRKMAPDLYKDMVNGLDSYISMLNRANISVNRFDGVIKSMEELKSTLSEQKNYLPIKILDVFPTFTNVTNEMYQGGKWTSDRVSNLNQQVRGMVDEFASNVKPSGHLREAHQGELSTKRYSLDLPSVMDSYIKNITRFNFTSKMTDAFMKSVQRLSSLEGTNLETHAKFMSDYIYSVHSGLLGQPANPRAQRVARWLTAWQFMSKLGLNLRGALRNATQSIQNAVYFGAVGTFKSLSYIKSNEMNKIVEEQMKRHGLFFAEPRELTTPFGLQPQIEMRNINGRDVPVYKDSLFGKGFTDYLEAAAKITGKPMQWVENKINRRLTFQIAFAQMHRKLSQNPAFVEKYVSEAEKGGAVLPGEQMIDKVSQELVNRSSRFAANMVRELHYEYASFAKPKALRTPVGAVLGQFATYSINFFNYQRKIIRDANDEIMSGYWGESAWRASRLASVYFITEAILSPLLSTDIGNLVQNDTLDRASQLASTFSDDPEVRKRAFYSKGPIIGTIGGATVSDLVTLGNVIGLYELDEDGWLSILAGYEDYADATDNDKIYDVARMLNTQIARGLFVSGPRMYNGTSFATVLGTELGLFKTKEVKDRRENIFANYLTPLGFPTPGDLKKSKKPVSKKEKRKQQSILRSLGSLEKLRGGVSFT